MGLEMAAGANNGSSSKVPILSHFRYEHLVAGISGGVTSTLILHPLDLIKIRFAVNSEIDDDEVKQQITVEVEIHRATNSNAAETGSKQVNDGRTTTTPQYRGLASAFVTIFRQEGLRGLYKGITPNVWGSGSAWGFYFMFYNSIKTWIQGGDTATPLGPTLHMIAASEAGVLTLVITNPIWVVKTRLCLQYEQETVPGSKYHGMTDALTKIYKYEGIRGLYRGFIPGIFGVSHGALQFMTYEEMKNSYNQYRKLPIDTKLRTSEYLVFAAISKLFAAAATYPYQVIRARLQDQHHSYEGVSDCIRQTWSFEGWKGFYKGIKPNLLRVVPATMITFVAYETVANKLTADKNAHKHLVTEK